MADNCNGLFSKGWRKNSPTTNYHFIDFVCQIYTDMWLLSSVTKARQYMQYSSANVQVNSCRECDQMRTRVCMCGVFVEHHGVKIKYNQIYLMLIFFLLKIIYHLPNEEYLRENDFVLTYQSKTYFLCVSEKMIQFRYWPILVQIISIFYCMCRVNFEFCL